MDAIGQNNIKKEDDWENKTSSEEREKQQNEEELKDSTQRTDALKTEQFKNDEKENEELNALRSKVVSLEADLAQRQASQTQLARDLKRMEEARDSTTEKEQAVRRIARRYKNQYDELVKRSQHLKKALSEKTQEGSALSACAQEQLRDEGRREAEKKLLQTLSSQEEQIRCAEQRLRDQETAHNEKMQEVTAHTNSLMDEVQTFCQKEEERCKLLESARSRVSELGQNIASLEFQLQALNERHLKDLEEKRELLNVKSQYEGKLAHYEKEKAETVVDRGERERLQHDLDHMKARCFHLQLNWELDVQRGKPNSGSGSAKADVDLPPMANTKTTAGPSHNATEQPTQQAVGTGMLASDAPNRITTVQSLLRAAEKYVQRQEQELKAVNDDLGRLERQYYTITGKERVANQRLSDIEKRVKRLRRH